MRRLLVASVVVLVAGVVVSVATGGAGSGAAQAGRWAITDLGTLGGRDSRATAINASGQVIGLADTRSGAEHTFLWQKGKMTDLGTLPGKTSSGAVAINDQGEIVGWSEWDPDGPPYMQVHSFVWENGTMSDLGTLGGRQTRAVAINNSGEIVGASDTHTTPYTVRAFRWKNGLMADLSTEGWSSGARQINERGQILGWEVMRRGDLMQHAFLWGDGRLTDLGFNIDLFFGGEFGFDLNDRGDVIAGIECKALYFGCGVLWKRGELHRLALSPVAINDRGDIVGLREKKSSMTGAYLWRKGRMTDLDTLGRGESAAMALNERGQIVGWADTKNGNSQHAFLWEGGRMRDLGTLGGAYSDSRAVAINGHNQIVGWGETKAGDTHAVLWTLRG